MLEMNICSVYALIFGTVVYTDTLSLTIISIGLQRDVPQYMAMPWFITWVIARTVSASKHTHRFMNVVCSLGCKL